MHGDKSARLEWAPYALAAYHETLTRIAADDPRTADLVRERVERALALIARFPAIGTPSLQRGKRSFAIPKTGHVLEYSVTRARIRIRLWYRARQDVKR